MDTPVLVAIISAVGAAAVAAITGLSAHLASKRSADSAVKAKDVASSGTALAPASQIQPNPLFEQAAKTTSSSDTVIDATRQDQQKPPSGVIERGQKANDMSPTEPVIAPARQARPQSTSGIIQSGQAQNFTWEIFRIGGRRVKVATGRIRQSINVFDDSDIEGNYIEVYRLENGKPHTTSEFLSANIATLSELDRFLIDRGAYKIGPRLKSQRS